MLDKTMVRTTSFLMFTARQCRSPYPHYCMHAAEAPHLPSVGRIRKNVC